MKRQLMMFNNFFKNKSVLVTGHTGFKGSWLALWLHELGAKVTGLALRRTRSLLISISSTFEI